MTCEEVIKNNYCLGCNLAELNINADNCKFREKSGLERCKEILSKNKQLSFFDN